MIDSHQHFWKYDPVRYGWMDHSMKAIQRDFLPGDVKPILLKNKIDGIIAIQADQSEAETEFLLKLASENDFIKGVVGWLDLSADNFEQRLKHFSENEKLLGLRHTVWDQTGEFLLEPNFQRGIASLSKFNLTYDLLVFDYQLASAVELVETFPNQKFVLDHMAKPDLLKKPSEEWIFQIEKIADNRNVFCKISGMFSEADLSEVKKEDIFAHFDVLLKNFDANRLIWGSDWPMCNISGSYEAALAVVKEYFFGFSENEKMKIFGGNTVRFYNL